MTGSDVIQAAIRDAVNGIRDAGPEPLLEFVNFKLRKSHVELTESDLITVIAVPDLSAEPRKAMHMALARWDAQADAAWAESTAPGSPERRERVLELLEFGTSSREIIDGAFPSVAQRDVVIATPGPWDPWYTPERRAEHDFYWKAYAGVLERKNWDPVAIAALNESTSNIVGRLADPAGDTSYQSKGLVVGYVQSGKTANFTGIVAKAIDSGYRLIIVLTGTIELLRGQTQRRLDMELVGEENILGGRDRNNADAIRDVDYIGNDDADWRDGKFLKHGIDINSQPDIPSVKRLTSIDRDYRLLREGLDALDFRRTGELRNPLKAVHDPENLFSVDARLAIIKKNPSALRNLLRDLQDVHADLREIPVLIIDDEADQASVNTMNPRSVQARADQKARTTINALISELLVKLPRAQYIGYTATPFANVFVSPVDSEDIFPRDFIVSLEPSSEYMGGKQFHDLEPLDDVEKKDPAVSNEAAFVRDLEANNDEEAERLEIRGALDAFVLSGAIKKWREATHADLSFRHHTMLVHQSVRQIEHSELADLIRSVWSMAGFSSHAGLARLRELYHDDFETVHESRDWGARLPERFDELKTYIGLTIDSITADRDPVVIVNGSKESDYKAMDFQTRPYWRIMVGGAKLSRGFTVEGLTISYYRRRASAADTLMQMGRWFGYRPGYRDLVRLYIARSVEDTRGNVYDLYDAFTAIIQDEEDFRGQLKKFSELTEDGHPVVRPIHVPPMVFQQLPWLRPTGANKMYNAELQTEGEGGALRDFPRQADRGDEGTNNTDQFDAVRGWLGRLGEQQTFEYVENVGGAPKVREFKARVAIVSADEIYKALDVFKWTDGYSFLPTLQFMKDAMARGALTDWAIVVPDLAGIPMRSVDGEDVQLLQRARRERGGFSGSSFRQRAAIERIAGNWRAQGGASAAALSTVTRGALLLTFAADPISEAKADRDPAKLADPIDRSDVATLFSLAVPYASAPRGRIGFRVRDHTKADVAIIDAV